MTTKKQAFLRRDRLIRGVSEDGNFRISVVKTTQVVRDAAQKHRLGPLAAELLGRALTGGLLLASTLKGEERLTARFEGDGPVELLVAEANAVGAVRGYVSQPQAALHDESENGNTGAGLGPGTLTVSKVLYNEARPVTGAVSLVSGDIQSDLSHYLHLSEQIPSILMLDVALSGGSVEEAGGLLVQALPGADPQQMIDIHEHLAKLPAISSLFRSGDYIDQVMHKAGGVVTFRELKRMLVDYFCPCTEDNFLSALAMLDIRELKEMAQKPQELICHYCAKSYLIPAAKIEALFLAQQAKMN